MAGKTNIAFSVLFFVVLFGGTEAVQQVEAHPLGGVLQKTVLSDLTNAVLIEYNTHIGSEVVLTLHPDKNFDGALDEKETAQFLDRVNYLLLGNITCRVGKRELALQEMNRQLTLEDPADFKNGLNVQFTWRVSLMEDGKLPKGLFSIKDNNFRAGELNRLNYFVTVLGDSGQTTLADEGRELIWDLAALRLVSQDSYLPPPSFQAVGVTTGTTNNEGETGKETDALKALFPASNGSYGLYLLGLFSAFILGSFHALSPGHGKSMVAAYLLGSQGRIIDAINLGLVVTATHVFSVIVLGLLALTLSRYTLSQNFFPWLGVASGALVFLTGYFILARMAFATSHHHEHHHDNPIEKTYDHSLKEVVSLGIAGGLAPCPSAIVVLLFAISVNRIATGLLIILSFSLGLAVVLILIGILSVTASRRITGFGSNVGWIKRLPVFSAGIIMVLGVIIGLNALRQAGILTLTF
ncbi:ABC-type uncharacterized transport system, permease component [Desulfocapsa sulfexigens DSM 10523]|uniref:ABC-type uncharacterized transport system, permease component n=2 Tax=Desulfocapsa TaxID=53318 RepID=M1PE36_DESSD|nr:ABC-type uncharacterized transport system, permease component [Desulfocapsa sulfexigens DSM 10523]